MRPSHSQSTSGCFWPLAQQQQRLGKLFSLHHQTHMPPASRDADPSETPCRVEELNEGLPLGLQACGASRKAVLAYTEAIIAGHSLPADWLQDVETRRARALEYGRYARDIAA